MKRFFLFFALSWPFLLTGQTVPGWRHAVKINLTSTVNKRLGLAYELLQAGRNNTLEFQASYQWHHPPPAHFFHGDWYRDYAELRSDFFPAGGIGSVVIEPWTYLGDGRPIPEMPHLTQGGTLQFQLGMMMSASPPYQGKKWRVFSQPAIRLSRHRWYEVNQTVQVQQEIRDSWNTELGPSTYTQVRRFRHSRQITEMRQMDKWLAGVTFDLGVCRSLGRAFFVEARLNCGFDFGSPNKELKSSGTHQLFAQGAIYAGYFIGKKTSPNKTL